MSYRWNRWLLLGSLFAPILASAQAAPALIPQPDRLQTCPGGLDLDARSSVSAPGDARGAEIAGFLRQAVAEQTGLALRPAAGKRASIRLLRDPSIVGDEAYRLQVGRDGATLRASGDRGLLWGVQTLRQLLPQGKATRVRLPCVDIADAPVLAYRGQMLDVSRHFYPVDFIKRQLDVYSYYKVNTFRWHLTDDQGWRIEIKRYPELTEVGAWRSEPDGSRHGGFYTQDEAREVVEYARQRGIMVIPEIEMPGHATAALVAYPELGCVPPAPAVPNYWGVHREIFCAGKEEVFDFLHGVLDEVVALFPAPYVHIGGDEVPKDRWQACESCQALMRREGLKDEHELQSWFVRRIQRYLQGKGRTLIGWDEILEGGADRDAVIEVWRGEEEGAKALANGNRIINASPYYIDTPLDRLTLQQLHGRDPLSDPRYRARAAQVWGAEAPLWSERAGPVNGEAMLYPRMLAFADISWNAGKPHDYADFKQRLAPHYAWLDARGVAYGPEDKPVARYGLSFDGANKRWLLKAEHGFADMRSHYTLDGGAPTLAAAGFAEEATIDRPGTLRVAPFRGARRALEPIGFRLVSHQAVGAGVRVAAPPDRPYATTVLADGILGGDDFGDGSWVGWQGADLDATLDLGDRRRFQRIAVDFLQQAGSWIVMPREVSFAISDDGKRWRTVHAEAVEADAMRPDRFVRQVAWRSPEPVRARWIRVVARSSGALPAGHTGAGSPSWLFADEIRVE